MNELSQSNKISRKWVQIALILFVVFLILLLLGFINTIFTYISFIPLLAFVWVTRKHVHCMICGRSFGVRVYLIQLLMNKEIYCPLCGEKIECEEKIEKGL